MVFWDGYRARGLMAPLHLSTHTHTHTHTVSKPDCTVTGKCSLTVQSAWFHNKVIVDNKLQLLVGPGADASPRAPCLPTHLHPADGSNGDAAKCTQPFCNSSRTTSPSSYSLLLPSSLPLYSSLGMRNRWGGAIKWICCYFSPKASWAEDVHLVSQTSQGWLQTHAVAKHTHTHAHTESISPYTTRSAFMLLRNLSNCWAEWWMAPDLGAAKNRH